MMVILKFFLIVAPILISVAFLTLIERKVLSLMGTRIGPNKVSFMGILQPIVDALKLSNKQVNVISNFSLMFYYFSSFFMIFFSLCLFLCTYSDPAPTFLKFSVLFFFLILGLNSFNSILSGWSTFSKYSLIGSVRTVTQLISYEACLYLIFFFFLIIFFSFDFSSFLILPLNFFILMVPICGYIWLPSFLAELNRTPYDFSEGESELVSGFNTEFGSVSFTFIFLAEYTNILFFCLLSMFLFFFSYNFFFLMIFFVLWVRAVMPRFRFDKLMYLCWKFYIPFLTFFLIFFCSSFLN